MIMYQCEVAHTSVHYVVKPEMTIFRHQHHENKNYVCSECLSAKSIFYDVLPQCMLMLNSKCLKSSVPSPRALYGQIGIGHMGTTATKKKVFVGCVCSAGSVCLDRPHRLTYVGAEPKCLHTLKLSPKYGRPDCQCTRGWGERVP